MLKLCGVTPSLGSCTVTSRIRRDAQLGRLKVDVMGHHFDGLACRLPGGSLLLAARVRGGSSRGCFSRRRGRFRSIFGGHCGGRVLGDGQRSHHTGFFVSGNVAVVLVLAGRGIDDRLLRLPRCDINVDPKLVDREVVRRGAVVRDYGGDVGVCRDRDLFRLEVDVVRDEFDRLRQPLPRSSPDSPRPARPERRQALPGRLAPRPLLRRRSTCRPCRPLCAPVRCSRTHTPRPAR